MPAGQGLQLPSYAYQPSAQVQSLARAVPALRRVPKPLGQVRQAVEPAASWNWLTGQGKQALGPAHSLKWPGRQSVQALQWGAVHSRPGPQGVQA